MEKSIIIKRTLITALLIVSSAFTVFYGYKLYEYFFMPRTLTSLPMPSAPSIGMPPPPPAPPMMGVEAGPIKVKISQETPWDSILKLLATILGTYLGIKVINKYVK